MALKVSAYSLVQIEELNGYLGADDSAARDEALRVECIEGTSRWIEKLCGRKFLSRTWTHDGIILPRLTRISARQLWLPNTPVTTLASLKLSPTETALTVGWDQGFTFDPVSGIVTLAEGLEFWDIPQSIDCLYIGGYLTTVTLGTPNSYLYGWQESAGDLRLAAIKLTAELVHRRNRSREGLASKTMPTGETLTYLVDAMLPDVKEILENYRVVLPV